MKNKILLAVSLLAFLLFNNNSHGVNQNANEKEDITVWSTPDVQSLARVFADEYCKLHPDLEYKILPIKQQGYAEDLKKTNGLAFVSQKLGASLQNPSLLQIVVGRDIIVPIMNAENPFDAVISQQGISVNKFRNAVTAGMPNWGVLLENGSDEPLKIYILDDESVQTAVAEFLDINPDILAQVETRTASEMIQLVQKDKNSMGFCRLLSVKNPEQQHLAENIKLVSIDKNGNSQIDYFEKIYNTVDDFERGVWIGKYPRALIQSLYAVSAGELANENVTEFLSWVITDGQQFMESSGFSELVYNERQSRLEKLNPQEIVLEVEQKNNARSRTILFIVLGILAVAIIARIVYRERSKKVKMPLGTFPKWAKILNESTLSFPNGLYFDKSHTWVFMEKEGTVKFGVDDFIPNVTGDFTRVILKKPGEKIKRKEPVVTLVQKGKQIQIHAPVSGTIKEINEALVVDPFVINNSPYEDGWIYTIDPSNWLREISFFKMGETYKEWIRNEITRLKDFLACSFNIQNGTEGKMAFQEGGEILINPLKDLGPELWEDFQSYFIETTEMY